MVTNSQKRIDWHVLSPESALSKLKTSPDQGLTSSEAKTRLFTYGRNTLPEPKLRGPIQILLDQLRDFTVVLLIGAAVIAGLIGELGDTTVIIVIILLNAILGFIQEYRAERAMAALNTFAAPYSQVIRSGNSTSTPASEIVPGDIVFLEAGNIVPADLRLIEAVQLKIDESALTGESQPSEKSTAALTHSEISIGDRHNLAYQGTAITYGRGSGVVFSTGRSTELGRISALLCSKRGKKTPLQARLTHLGKSLATCVIGLCVVIFLVGILQGEPPYLMFMTALSLAVAAVPEALPAVVTVSLALGAKRMIKHKALIRRLTAVETLGSVTYLCSDKTGTLTQNKMQVGTYQLNGHRTRDLKEISKASPSISRPLLQAMALNNDAYRGEGQSVRGDPTEVALFEAADRLGFSKPEMEKKLPRIAEIPFSSERGKMSTLHRGEDDEILVFTKGAPEKVLAGCVHEWKRGELIPIDQKAALAAAEAIATEGFRVVAIAHKRIRHLPLILTSNSIESELTLIALVGLIDPPRPEVKSAIKLCQSASINVVMITGDHPATALAIARELGIVHPTSPSQELHGVVLTGKELTQLSLSEFESRVKDIRVYARTSPEQKIKIVQALQDLGEVVAMTGDGVNDAPALRHANIGVAMGKIGTDVARKAAHMVLLDDHFATIVAAVSEGRCIFDNIRKFIKFVLTGNSAEILTLFLSSFLGLPMPFLPIHILWINLVTDGLPGLALVAEPAETGIMKRAPRNSNESVFAHGLWQHVLWAGLFIAGVSLSIQAWAYHGQSAHWQSMVFTVITLSQMFHVMTVRSEQKSFFNQGFFSNLPLLGAVLFTFILQMLTLYVPFLNKVLKTKPLTAQELMICLAVSPIIILAVECEKWMVRRGFIYQQTKDRSAAEVRK